MKRFAWVVGTICLLTGCGVTAEKAVEKKEEPKTVVRPDEAKKEEVAPELPKKRIPIPDEKAVNPGLEGEIREHPVVPEKITEIDLERLFLLKGEGKVLLVDVRPRIFFAIGHIGGAISLPLKSYETAYPKKKKLLDEAVQNKQVIVIYCADLDCPDGYAVARKLAERGYSTSLYKGGWAEWKAAGLE